MANKKWVNYSKKLNRPKSYKTPQGAVGYDNPRENIDPTPVFKVARSIDYIGKTADITNISGQHLSIGNTISGQSVVADNILCNGKISGQGLVATGISGMELYNTTGTKLYEISPHPTITTIPNTHHDTILQHKGPGDIQFYTKLVIGTGSGITLNANMEVGTNKYIRLNDTANLYLGNTGNRGAINWDETEESILIDPDNAGTTANIVRIGKLGAGNLICNNISGQNIFFKTATKGLAYADIHIHAGAVTNGMENGVFKQLSGQGTWTQGGNNNISTTISGQIILHHAGTYKVSWSISASSTGANNDYDIDLFSNDNNLTDADARRKFGAAADIGNMGASGIISGMAGDVFDLRARNNGASNSLTMYDANFNIVQIAG